MAILPTVAIHNPRNPRYRLIINERDYDPARHRLWGESPNPEPEPKPEPEPEPNPADDEDTEVLPDFVALANLAKTAERLIDVPGVGAKTAAGILANRPPLGYLSWNQLVELNSELNRVPWDDLKEWVMD